MPGLPEKSYQLAILDQRSKQWVCTKDCEYGILSKGNSTTVCIPTYCFIDEAEVRSATQGGHFFFAVHIMLFYHTYKDDQRTKKTVFIICSNVFVIVISQTDVAVSALRVPALKLVKEETSLNTL